MANERRNRLRVISEDSGSEPLPGQVVAEKYTLKRLIGRGGVGDIYLASEEREDDEPRTVVVKLLAQRWRSDADAVARFEREAMRLRSLEHPNIVSTYDSGVSKSRPYIVMEFINGELLSDYILRHRRLSLQEFVPIAAQILKGSGHAHSRELMIRDIKPSNIMLCERKGRANFVKMLDFGLAKFTRDDSPITEGYVLGTAGYLAPEAIKGEPLDLRVDVYSIGALFYHMLSGSLPFDGAENATIFYKTINERPPDLRRKLPRDHKVPEELIKLIEDCLEKNRDRRPTDANIVVERLIDAVPASMFKLPRVVGATDQVGGNTGLVELLGDNPSDRHTPVPEASPPPLAETAPVPTPRKRRLVEWAAIALIACLASAATAFAVSRTGEDRDEKGKQAPGGDGVRIAAGGGPTDAPAPEPTAPGASAAASAGVIAPPSGGIGGTDEVPVAEEPVDDVVIVDPEDDLHSPRRTRARIGAPARRIADATEPLPSATTFEALPPPPRSEAKGEERPEPRPEPRAVEEKPVSVAPKPAARESVFLSAERPVDLPTESRPLIRAD